MVNAKLRKDLVDIIAPQYTLTIYNYLKDNKIYHEKGTVFQREYIRHVICGTQKNNHLLVEIKNMLGVLKKRITAAEKKFQNI